MDMKCFVTGATGHIGNVLVRELYAAGHEVTALVLPNDKHQMIDAFATIITGNVLDQEFLFGKLIDYDIVYHLAGIVEIGSGKKKKIFKVNVEGTKNMVKACLKNKIRRLVYTSSVHAIPELKKGLTMTEIDTFDPNKVGGLYAKSKAMATDFVLNHRDLGLEIVVVHPAGVIGPYDYQMSNVSQLFVDFILGKLTAYLRGGYNFVDVRDAARGIRLAGEKGRSGECYILSGNEITVKELLDLIADSTGRKRIKTKIAYWFILAMSGFAELYYKSIRQKPLFTRYSVVVLNANRSFSNLKAVKELGYTTRSLAESVKDTVKFAYENNVEKHNGKYRRKLIKE
jgi:dihydroflavonol-4-reductase